MPRKPGPVPKAANVRTIWKATAGEIWQARYLGPNKAMEEYHNGLDWRLCANRLCFGVATLKQWKHSKSDWLFILFASTLATLGTRI